MPLELGSPHTPFSVLVSTFPNIGPLCTQTRLHFSPEEMRFRIKLRQQVLPDISLGWQCKAALDYHNRSRASK